MKLHRTEKAPLEGSRGAVCALRRFKRFYFIPLCTERGVIRHVLSGFLHNIDTACHYANSAVMADTS